MFEQVTLRGQEATIVWGYHTAAVCSRWAVRRTSDGRWMLSAVLRRVDAFQLRQRPLKFTAPRVGGYFCWPVVSVTLAADRLSGVLDQPES